MDTSYRGVVERLRPFTKIFVTGPQRSGTTIVAAALAFDLGYWFYPEEQIRNFEWWRVKRLFERTDNFVLQAPGLCYRAHMVQELDLGGAVVLVRREIEGIVASERRVNWTGGPFELKRYGLKEGVISEIKYRYWDEYQKSRIRNAYEIEYESLVGHPMWIPKVERVDFGPRQYTRIGLHRAEARS